MAMSAMPLWAEPYEHVASCQLKARNYRAASETLRTAAELDPGNWRYSWGLAAAGERGEDPRTQARQAFVENPLEPRTRELSTIKGAKEWRKVAPAGPLGRGP